jgi:bla regulator protein BlaR1
MKDDAECRRGLPAIAVVAALAVLVVASGPIASRLWAQAPPGESPAPRPTFEVASVKLNKSDGPMGVRRFDLGQPGGYVTMTNCTLRILIANAYLSTVGLDVRYRISGVPSWIESESFDIAARADGNPTLEQKKLMLQSLLADRFKLTMHHETRQLAVYALVLANAGNAGPRLIPHRDDTKCFDSSGSAQPPCDFGLYVNRSGGDSVVKQQNLPLERFAGLLTVFVGRPVLDRTGLSGKFDFTFEFAAQPSAQPGPESAEPQPDPTAAPALPTALREQLGLKLKPTTGPVDVLVVDHVEEPSPN